MESILFFKDSMTWNGAEKTAISVRDGVLEYYGHEIGQEPANKVFKVYRSPATIARAAAAIVGIPLIHNHIDVDEVPAPEETGGQVTTASVIDFFDESTDSKLAVKNTVEVSAPFLEILESGERELSLGYKGRLVPHDVYDFAQVDIEPKHLAIVGAGRGGSSCSFIDRKPGDKNMKKKFFDADGQPNLEEIVEIAQALPEALKALPMDRLQEILPTLQEIVSIAGGAKPAESDLADDDKAKEDDKDKLSDEEKEKKDGESLKITDSKPFKDAVAKQLAVHTETIEKAKSFLDDGYSFIGKSTAQIMRDALTTEHGKQNFTDAELPIAFKLLKKSGTDLTKFGDSSAQGGLVDRVKKLAQGE